MQRILNHGSLRRLAAARSLLAGAAGPEPTAAFCCCVLRPLPPPASRRWLSTTASSKAAQQPKQQAAQGEEPQAGSTPQTQEVQREDAGPEEVETDPLQDKSIGLVQRFKRTFKQYGKVMIPVHLVTSSVWFGTFYYAAMKGVNVVQFLEMVGLPESLVSVLRNSSSGYALTAYAMYKIATPARYTVTLGGTSLSVQYLRKHGYLTTPPPVKEYIQDKMEETKEKLSGKMEETKEKLSGKMEETKEKLSGKMEETKERFSERMEETKGLFSEKMEETKDKFSEKLQETKDRVTEGKSFFRKD
ncbi:uncharacterized protein C18orf19 homolog A-like [Clinocottus analis]|uniref:uncharacterized protein C18orf19 homolog A-like n=1 Tax=Clinocottus analis TaxID=304258 RepID=UPI0035BFABB6